jgi:uncharacterized LabA/DUF88 family protein
MHKHKDQRVGVFVDVQNMYYSAKNLYNSYVNFGKVLEVAVAGRKLIRAAAYVVEAGLPEEPSFFKALQDQGFRTESKELQIFAGGHKKADWDVGISVDAIKMSKQLDVVILVTGDGDFVPLVEYLQYHGVLVEVIAFEKTSSSKLIEKVDDFIDLSSDMKKFLIKARVSRNTSARTAVRRSPASQQTSSRGTTQRRTPSRNTPARTPVRRAQTERRTVSRPISSRRVSGRTR